MSGSLFCLSHACAWGWHSPSTGVTVFHWSSSGSNTQIYCMWACNNKILLKMILQMFYEERNVLDMFVIPQGHTQCVLMSNN